mgnify:CR=1 FL=1
MHTVETVTQTNANYNKAIERFAKRGFNRLSLGGSGYSHFLGESFASYDGEITEADSVSIRIDNLFDYGNPKHIEKTHWVYRSSFVKIEFYAIEKFDLICEENISDNENNYKLKLIPNEHSIRVRFKDMGLGIGDWTDKKIKELKKLANTCKPDVKAKLLESIETASKELNEWREAKTNLLKEII